MHRHHTHDEDISEDEIDHAFDLMKASRTALIEAKTDEELIAAFIAYCQTAVALVKSGRMTPFQAGYVVTNTMSYERLDKFDRVLDVHGLSGELDLPAEMLEDPQAAWQEFVELVENLTPKQFEKLAVWKTRKEIEAENNQGEV